MQSRVLFRLFLKEKIYIFKETIERSTVMLTELSYPISITMEINSENLSKVCSMCVYLETERKRNYLPRYSYKFYQF